MAMIVKAARKGADLRPHVEPPKSEPDAPDFSPPIHDPEILPADLRTRREVAYALCFSARFDEWVSKWVAWHGWARDDVEPAMLMLTCYFREMMLAAAIRPELFPAEPGRYAEGSIVFIRPEPVEPEDGEQYAGPATESDAAYHGLSVCPPPRRRDGGTPTMPGCHGMDAGGGPCPDLRIVGHKFCPSCERVERKKIRAEQRGA